MGKNRAREGRVLTYESSLQHAPLLNKLPDALLRLLILGDAGRAAAVTVGLAAAAAGCRARGGLLVVCHEQ